MTVAEFWGATWRELAAHRKAHDNALDFWSGQHAGIMAALFNGPVGRTDKRMWTPEMFMPGYSEATNEPQWKRDLAASRAAIHVVKRPQDSAQGQDTLSMQTDRTSRAKAAKARGESRETIDLIMTGRA